MSDAINRVGAVPSIGTGHEPPPPGWQDAIANVVKNGREEELEGLSTISFKVGGGERATVHQKSVINVWGQRDPQSGVFKIAYVSLNTEDWRLRPDGRFFVDEWIHRLSPDGRGWTPLHYFQIVRPDGTVDDSGSQPQSAGDPRVNLTSLVAMWARYQPPVSVAEPAAPSDGARRAADALTPAMADHVRLAPPRGAKK